MKASTFYSVFWTRLWEKLLRVADINEPFDLVRDNCFAVISIRVCTNGHDGSQSLV